MEICAVSITPMWDAFPDSSRAALIAFWGSAAVRLLELPTLEPYNIADFPANESKLPSSVLLHVFDEGGDDGKSSNSGTPFALVGLSDGRLVAYELDKKGFRVKSRRTMVLGNTPLRLSVCQHSAARAPGARTSSLEASERKRVVFVSGSRPTVLFMENGRLQHSPMNVKVRGRHYASIFLTF